MKNIGKGRLLSTLVAAFLCVPLLAACGGDGGSGGTAAKSNADLLKEGVNNMKNVKTFHLKVDANQAGQDIKLEGDIDVANNKMKLDMTAQGQNVDVIAIGSETYMSTDDGASYTKAPEGTNMGLGSFTDMFKNLKPEDIDKNKDAFKDGTPKEEQMGGVTTRHMTASCKETPALCAGASKDSNTMQDAVIDLWVSTDAKPLIYKMQVKGAGTGDQAADGSFEWSKFDEPVTVEAPPTQ